MRFIRFLFLMITVGALQMLLAPRLDIPNAQGEYLFLIAFHTALHARSYAVVPAFFIAGISRDIFLGQHLGVNGMLYVLFGLIVLQLRGKVLHEHIFTRVVFLFLSLFVISLMRGVLEGASFDSDLFFSSGVNATYTALISPLFGLILEFSPLCTWSKSLAERKLRRL